MLPNCAHNLILECDRATGGFTPIPNIKLPAGQEFREPRVIGFRGKILVSVGEKE
jgi:hypothetical protein